MPTERDPDTLTLRPAVAEDVGGVTEVYLSARAASAPAMPAPVHDAEAVRGHLATVREHKEMWVAEDAGGRSVAAFAVLGDHWLDDLYVHPRHQRRGIGSALLDLAKARRPDGFSLWVFETNSTARRFYRRHRLVELERTDGAGNEEHAPDIRMAWPGADPMAFWRCEIDDVDSALAGLLDRRAALTGQVQRLKRGSGQPGRDPAREAEIVDRMATLAPRLGREALTRIMATIITETLGAASDRLGSGGGRSEPD